MSSDNDNFEGKEERLQALIDSSPLALVEFGLDTRVGLWNPAAERIFGWTREEMLGRGGLPMAPPSKRAENQQLFERIRAGASLNDYETVRQRKDGTLVAVSIAAAPVSDGSGRVVGNLVAYTDITERKAQDAEVHRLNAELHARLEELAASRARIVTAGDVERRRLERNLHDGAQQRLVALSLSLRLALAKLDSDPAGARATLAGAGDELVLALGALEVRRHREPAAAEHLLTGPAEDAFGGGVPEPDARVVIELHERDRRGVDQRLQPLLLRPAFRDVGVGDHVADDAAGVVSHGRGGDRHGNQRPVPVQADGLEVVDGLAGGDAREQLFGLGTLGGRGQRQPATAQHLLAGPAEDAFGGSVPEPDAGVEPELHERERRGVDQRLQLLTRPALADVPLLDGRECTADYVGYVGSAPGVRASIASLRLPPAILVSWPWPRGAIT